MLVFGGTKDRDDLIFWSTLAGDRDEPITTTDLHGRVASRTVRKVAVVPPAQIANLPEGRVLLIRRGIAPVLGRTTMVWRRRDFRWARWAGAHPHGARRLILTVTVARVLARRAGRAGLRTAHLAVGAVTGAVLGYQWGVLLAGLLDRTDATSAVLLGWSGLLLGLLVGVVAAGLLRAVVGPVRRWLRTRVTRPVGRWAAAGWAVLAARVAAAGAGFARWVLDEAAAAAVPVMSTRSPSRCRSSPRTPPRSSPPPGPVDDPGRRCDPRPDCFPHSVSCR